MCLLFRKSQSFPVQKCDYRQPLIDILERTYRCSLCLKPWYTIKTCSSKYVCRKYNEKHNYQSQFYLVIVMSHKMTVRIVLLLLLIRVKVFFQQTHQRWYLVENEGWVDVHSSTLFQRWQNNTETTMTELRRLNVGDPMLFQR